MKSEYIIPIALATYNLYVELLSTYQFGIVQLIAFLLLILAVIYLYS